MKANRKVMLGAALVVAVVALAGVGYAAVGYKAETSTTDNSVQDSNYIVISADAGSYSATPVEKQYAFDTVTTYDDVEGLQVQFTDCYDVTGTEPSPVTLGTELEYGGVDYNAAAVKTFTITIDFSKASADVTKAEVTVTLTGTNIANSGNAIKVFLVKGTNEVLTVDPTLHTATFDVVKATPSASFNIGLYIAAPVDPINYSVGSLSNDVFVEGVLSFEAVTSDAA